MKIGDFFASKKGKLIFNFAYCWGACLVITGAVCKMVNMPFSTELLMIGMTVEVVIFFLAGFETQHEEYKWERVFPRLQDDDNTKQENASSDESKYDELIAIAKAKMEANMAEYDKLLANTHALVESRVEKYDQVLLNANDRMATNAAKFDKITESSYTQVETKINDVIEQMDIMSHQMSEINKHYARLLDAMGGDSVATKN